MIGFIIGGICALLGFCAGAATAEWVLEWLAS